MQGIGKVDVNPWEFYYPFHVVLFFDFFNLIYNYLMNQKVIRLHLPKAENKKSINQKVLRKLPEIEFQRAFEDWLLTDPFYFQTTFFLMNLSKKRHVWNRKGLESEILCTFGRFNTTQKSMNPEESPKRYDRYLLCKLWESIERYRGDMLWRMLRFPWHADS